MQESVRRIIEAEEARMGKISNIWRKRYPENNVIFSQLLRKNIIILDSELFFYILSEIYWCRLEFCSVQSVNSHILQRLATSKEKNPLLAKEKKSLFSLVDNSYHTLKKT